MMAMLSVGTAHAATQIGAGPLVIRATGPSAALFKPGQRLGDAAIALKRGDLVVVLDKNGTRRFVGPSVLDYRAASKAAEDRYNFSDITQPDGTRAVIAATRRMTQPEPADDQATPAFNPVPADRIWAVVLAAKGPHCVAAGKPVTIVRGAAAKAETLEIARSDGKKLKLAFAAGQQARTAPAQFFAGAGSYATTLASKAQAISIRPLLQPKGGDQLEALEATAQGLAAAGCQRQFALLADQIAPKQP